MDNLSDIIVKVQRLLSLANSSNTNEATAAAAAADRLIAKYRLSSVDLSTSSEGEEPIEEDTDFIYETGRTTPWKMKLMNVLVRHYGLSVYNKTHFPKGRQVSRFRLIGRKSDIAYAKYMFAWLVSEGQRFADSEAKGRGYGRVYVESFCRGFVDGIETQLRANHEEMKKEATSAAIVKLDARESEAIAWRDSHLNLRTVTSYSHVRTDQFGLDRGRQVGESFHLGPSLGNGSTKMLGK